MQSGHGFQGELENIARFLNVSPEGLRNRLNLEPSGFEDWFNMPGNPCFFLKNNECLIYPVRPQACRLFPGGYLRLKAETEGVLEIPTYCSIIEKFFAERILGFLFRSLRKHV